MEMIERTNKKALNCNHDFHADCVNRWLSSNDICPLCRAPQREEEPDRTTYSSRYVYSEDPFTREEKDYKEIIEQGELISVFLVEADCPINNLYFYTKKFL